MHCQHTERLVCNKLPLQGQGCTCPSSTSHHMGRPAQAQALTTSMDAWDRVLMVLGMPVDEVPLYRHSQLRKVVAWPGMRPGLSWKL